MCVGIFSILLVSRDSNMKGQTPRGNPALAATGDEWLERGARATQRPYGVTLLMRVAQLPRLARVPPQLPNGTDVYC